VTDFRDLVTRVELLRRVSASDAALVGSVKSARSEAEKTRQSLENRRSEQVVLLRRSKEMKHEVELALEGQRSYLASVDDELKTLIAKERERQERVARERAAAETARLAEQVRVQAARAAEARAAAEGADRGITGEAAGAPASSTNQNPLGSPGPATSVGQLPPARTSALAVARSFIGVTPYVWGGVTPAGFDCSGLTMYCYREVGINIPRTSRQQYNYGSRIPADRLDLLQPGDLVFFGRDADPGRIHHVGIYSGNGNYVHAPQAGELVGEASLLGRIAARGDYVGAVRP
jgi:cell wall-associated NlpC family hydrolase